MGHGRTLSLEEFAANYGTPQKAAPKNEQKKDGNERFPKNTSKSIITGKGGSGKPRNGGGRPQGTKSKIATAPYNFIALPEKILPSPLDSEAMRGAVRGGDKQKARTLYGEYLETASLDGYIDLTLETLTPFFLGGDAETYAPAGTPIIPGSSLRGMVKNLVKIVTLGAMRPDEDFTDRRLYYRCMMPGQYAWGKTLHQEYNDRMAAPGSRTKKTLPGFLAKRGSKYVIYPMTSNPERVLIRVYEKSFPQCRIQPNMRDVRVDWHDADVYAISGSQRKERLFETDAQYQQKLDEVKQAKERHDNSAVNRILKGIGKQFVKKYALSAVDWEHPLPVADKTIQDYRDDANRRGVDLLRVPGEGERCGAIKDAELRERYPRAPKNIERIAPCYYLPDGRGGVEAFGHGQDFRIPYKHSVADAVPRELQGTAIDFADAMFGLMRARDKAFWAGRVFFEDARPEGTVAYEEANRARPLSSPNPTSYQLYLKQPYKDGQREWDSLNHWDSKGACVRGYKLYWHNAKPDAWRASEEEIAATDKKKDGTFKEKSKQLTREITPVKKGVRFRARIRFSSLRPEELGALLMVFHMEQAKNLAYKIGKGKSIGLGSVRVADFSLFVNDGEQYRSLFAPEGGWNDPCVSADDKIQTYLTAFKEYVKGQGMENPWQHVMGDLAAILAWRDGWDEGKVSEPWETATKEMRAAYSYNEKKQEWENKFNDGFLRRDVLLPLREVLKEAGVTP